jgi:hypothetical protein
MDASSTTSAPARDHAGSPEATHDLDRRLTPPSGGWPIRVSTASRFGRGLVTTRAVNAGEVLEACGLLVLPRRAEAAVRSWGYVFDVAGRSAVAAGAVSFVNHSYRPNARYDVDEVAELVELSALVDIEAGAEVLVNYNGDPDGDGPLWFDVVG